MDMDKKIDIQKACEILTQLSNGKGKLNKSTYEDGVDDALEYLSRALED